MQKKMKNTSGNAGFTLVELIVVIAILAILGAAGTVGYSAYVDRANRAADEQMIHDVEQALIMGMYSKSLMNEGQSVSVGLSQETSADPADVDYDQDTVLDVEEMMVNSFGANWKDALKLKWDGWAESDKGKIQKLVSENPELFGAVPNSSFFSTAGNTDAIVGDVDEIVTALNGVLDGMGGYAFSRFWGEDFHDSVDKGGLGDDWNNNDQMAANLTVFAAANQITGADNTRKDGWVDSWKGETTHVSAGVDGYVADLVMQYAQCVAVYNYAKNLGGPDAEGIDVAYQALENAMVGLSNPQNGYVNDFNTALDNYWKSVGSLRKDWQKSGQAEKDAEAMLATLMALNTLEDTYVNKGQADKLTQANAFTNFGAADVLDAMVSAAASGVKGEWIVSVTVKNGIPTIDIPLTTD